MIQLLQRHGFIYDQLPAILWAVLMFVLSSIPGVTLPDLKFVPSDKAVHVFAYFILCALSYRALLYQDRFPVLARRSLAIAVISSILYGISDEFHQSFVPNREASAFDLAADSIGALLFLSYAVLRSRSRSKTPKPV